MHVDRIRYAQLKECAEGMLFAVEEFGHSGFDLTEALELVPRFVSRWHQCLGTFLMPF